MIHATSETYLEQCLAAVSAIDTEEIAEMRLGPLIGVGSGFRTHSLGELSIGYVGHVAVKLPKQGQSSITRIIEEIATMQTIVGADERLQQRLPAFLGLITLAGNAHAVLTEDASRGKTVRVLDTDMSTSLSGAVHAQLAPGASLKGDTKYYMAFDVGGEERLLDATPSPYGIAPPELEANRAAVRLQILRLHVAVPTASPLADSLARGLHSR